MLASQRRRGARIHAAFPPSRSCCKSGACTCQCDPWTRCTRAASRCIPHPCSSCDGKRVSGTETDRHKSTFLGRSRSTRPSCRFCCPLIVPPPALRPPSIHLLLPAFRVLLGRDFGSLTEKRITTLNLPCSTTKRQKHRAHHHRLRVPR